MTTGTRSDLITKGNAAAFTILNQVDLLIDLMEKLNQRPLQDVKRERIISEDLSSVLVVFESSAGKLWQLVEDWSRGKFRDYPEVLHSEVELLNELYINIETLAMFFMRQNIELGEVSLNEVRKAHATLLNCNMLL